MFEFFTQDGTSVGKAWSLLRCSLHKQGNKHDPHPHSLDNHPNLGPFMCSGHPMVSLTHSSSTLETRYSHSTSANEPHVEVKAQEFTNWFTQAKENE